MIFNLPQRLISIRVLFVLAVFSLAFISCRDGGPSESSSQQAPQRTNITGNNNPSNQSNTNPTTTSPNTGAASAEFHYICANNCEGSGANAAGSCSVCGEELIHNTAFHSGDPGAANNSPQMLDGDDNSFSSKINPIGDPESSTPAASSGGSGFHYTCSAGCGGGASDQGACPSCGAELVHNAAFHSGGGATATPGAPGQAAPSSGNKYPSVFNTPGGAPPANRINSSGGGNSSGNGFHYICSAGCGGGGSGQGSCPSCGAALVHNDAFH